MTIKNRYPGLFWSNIRRIEHYSNNVRHYSRKIFRKKVPNENDLIYFVWNVYRQLAILEQLIPEFMEDVDNKENREWLERANKDLQIAIKQKLDSYKF